MKRIATAILLAISLTIGGFILYSYFQTEQKNRSIQENIQKTEAELKSLPPPPPPPILQQRKKDGVVVESKPIEIEDTADLKFKQEQQIRIELIGILKLQINENNSWETILKLLVLILFSYGGIKYINRRFA